MADAVILRAVKIPVPFTNWRLCVERIPTSEALPPPRLARPKVAIVGSVVALPLAAAAAAVLGLGLAGALEIWSFSAAAVFTFAYRELDKQR